MKLYSEKTIKRAVADYCECDDMLRGVCAVCLMWEFIRGDYVEQLTASLAQAAQSNRAHTPAHLCQPGSTLEPIEFLFARGLGEAFCIGNAINHLILYNHKRVPIEDLRKARNYIGMLIDHIEGRSE